MDPEHLRSIPVFATMSESDLRRIATFATEDSAPAGATLVREGDYSNEMVAIESGTADVIQGERTVAGLGPGDVFVDFPERAAMLGVNLPLRTRSGAVERLTDAGRAGHLGLPRVADELYRSARRLRIFVAGQPTRSLEWVQDILTWPADELERRLTQEPILQ